MELALWDPPGEDIKALDVHSTRACSIIPEENIQVIYKETLVNVRTNMKGGAQPIDLTEFVTPCRYRFIDCLAFVRDEVLQLVETKDLPVQAYAAISHVWASLPPEEAALTERGFFLVKCEESNDGGPISIDVLHHASLAALQEGVRYIWLDRICILQTPKAGKDDKRWQIMNMHGIYLHSRVTLVLLAGLQRFVGKREQTTWMNRAWTFQEVIVPPESKVLFVEYSQVNDVLQAAVRMLPVDHYFKILQNWWGDDKRDGSREQRGRLIVALENRTQFRRGDLSDVLNRCHTIWDFVQWRTSARQADVIFSVMGMLDITLDPSHFDKNDRFGATLAMAQEILCKDPAEHSSVDIPLWKRFRKARVDRFKEQGLWNVKTYMMSLPSIIELSELQSELEDSSVMSFTSVSKVSLEYGVQGDGDTKELEPDERIKLETLNAAVMGRVDARDAHQHILMAVNGVNHMSRTRERARRICEQIPAALIRKVSEDSVGINRPQSVFKTDNDITIGLCKRLSLVDAVNRSNTQDSKAAYIFGCALGANSVLASRRRSHVRIAVAEQLHSDAISTSEARHHDSPLSTRNDSGIGSGNNRLAEVERNLETQRDLSRSAGKKRGREDLGEDHDTEVVGKGGDDRPQKSKATGSREIDTVSAVRGVRPPHVENVGGSTASTAGSSTVRSTLRRSFRWTKALNFSSK
ncbi:hypothetical protein VNI00_011466 [Paramarasmius palmivorus]|uniref:Heterokaryon incompatibility domain-containing protein n=1 Tax=Paramarasmius palmivorus TaxID=297713 RepID=A0AAW0CEP9_9AGAR